MTDNPDARAHDRSGLRLYILRTVWMVLRIVGSVAVLGTLYYLLPLDRVSAPLIVVILAAGLAAFVVLLVLQVRLIIRSPFPGMRGVEALATSVPFFLLLFASAYVAMSGLSPESFSVHLSHTDSLYFTVTVFSTVGFGDIVAKSDTARLVVTGQMITDLIVLGVAIKIVFGAVRRGLERTGSLKQGPDQQ